MHEVVTEDSIAIKCLVSSRKTQVDCDLKLHVRVFKLEAKDLGEMNSICNSLQWQMNICIVKAVFKSENPFSGFAFNAEQESLRLFFA